MMQDNNFLEEISSIFTDSVKSSRIIIDQVRQIPFPKIDQDIRTVHPRGSIIKLLILFKLMAVPTVNRLRFLDFEKMLPFGKDVLYKVKNSPLINWRRLLIGQSLRCTQGIHIDVRATDPWERPCFIIDDSDMPKTGKFIELIGRVFSHVSGKYPLGFKSMNLSYWSGQHLLHVDFSLHLEKGKTGNQGMQKKDLQRRFKKSRKRSDPGNVRFREASEKKTSSAMRMIKRAVKEGFLASYLLADSWFFSSVLVEFAIANGLHLVSRPKWNQWKYIHEGKSYTLGELIKKLQRQKKYKTSRQLHMRTATAFVVFKGVPMKIFFFKDKKRGSKWNALITTDKVLGAVQAFKVYQNRWSIEVSYKEIKQHLGYGKCQSRDFDGQISDAALTLMAYNQLSQQKAINDYQSIGYLFAEVSQDWLKPNFIQRFWDRLYILLVEIAEIVEKDILELIDIVMKSNNTLAKFSKISRILTAET